MSQLINAKLPNRYKRFRACMDCHFILTEQQFIDNNCPNCNAQDFDYEVMLERTNANYERIISVRFLNVIISVSKILFINKKIKNVIIYYFCFLVFLIINIFNIKNKVPGPYALNLGSVIKFVKPKREDEDEEMLEDSDENDEGLIDNGHGNNRYGDIRKDKNGK